MHYLVTNRSPELTVISKSDSLTVFFSVPYPGTAAVREKKIFMHLEFIELFPPALMFLLNMLKELGIGIFSYAGHEKNYI